VSLIWNNVDVRYDYAAETAQKEKYRQSQMSGQKTKDKRQ